MSSMLDVGDGAGVRLECTVSCTSARSLPLVRLVRVAETGGGQLELRCRRAHDLGHGVVQHDVGVAEHLALEHQVGVARVRRGAGGSVEDAAVGRRGGAGRC